MPVYLQGPCYYKYSRPVGDEHDMTELRGEVIVICEARVGETDKLEGLYVQFWELKRHGVIDRVLHNAVNPLNDISMVLFENRIGPPS